MEEYIQFAQRHPILVFGFIALAAYLIWFEFQTWTRKYKVVNAKDAVHVINRDNSLILDVRTQKELATGKIRDARHIELTDLSKHMAELDKYKQAPILVYCQMGNRSGHACNELSRKGFEEVYSMQGGLSAWESENLPLTQNA